MQTTSLVFFSFLITLLLAGCGNEVPLTAMPYVPINKVIDLNNLPYQKLQFDGGFVYETGGHRGLLIYRKSASLYYVYERACTNNPQNACEVVRADGSGFFLQDDCCQSRFDWEGRPIAGVARFDLLRYRSSLSGSLLFINN
jgi:hypothetical protein